MPRRDASSSTIAINGFSLRWGRKFMNVTPAELAAGIDRDRSYIVKIETGAVTQVSTDTFERIVEVLRVPDRRALLAWPHDEQVSA